MRKIGINYNCYGGISCAEHVELMKANGFTGMFMGSENPKLDEMMQTIAGTGIEMENLHAPFDKINDIWFPGEAGDNMLSRLLACVDACAKYGIPAMVVHLSSGLKPPYVNETGHDRFVKLMEYAAEKNVTVCYENQRFLSNLAFAFEEFKDQAAFCWDCGHEFCFTPGRQYMPLFGKKLAALHIHDNSCVFNSDDHMIPGDAKADFDYVAEQIAKSGYQGTLMLELIRKKSELYADWTAEQYFSHAAEAARKLVAMIEEAEARL